jgi:pyruvate/2-oxoglutarate dehydrogenase complex dihydrolipoamide acyltransferase (E2) component
MTDTALIEVKAKQFDAERGCAPMMLFWYMEEGTRVGEGDDLAEVETAREVYVVQAPTSGVLSRILVREGEGVDSGQTLAFIETDE